MSKKASLAYFRSRMSSFLNPLFLGSIATLCLLAFVIWQFFLQPNQFARNDDDASNSGINPAQGTDGTGNLINNPAQTTEQANNLNAPQSQSSLTENKEKTIDENFLSQAKGKEIFNPISGNAREQGQSGGAKLYDQIVGLDLFPELLPNQGDGSDLLGIIPQSSGGVNVPPPQSAQSSSQYGRYGYQPGTGGSSSSVPTAPTPLAAAVNQVMANSNYNRYVRQMPAQPQTSPYAVTPPTGVNNNQVMTNGYNSAAQTSPYAVTPSTGFSNNQAITPATGFSNNQAMTNGYNSSPSNNTPLFPNARVSGSSYQNPANPNASFGY